MEFRFCPILKILWIEMGVHLGATLTGPHITGSNYLSVFRIGGGSSDWVSMLIAKFPFMFLKDSTGRSNRYLIISIPIDPVIILTAVITFSGTLLSFFLSLN